MQQEVGFVCCWSNLRYLKYPPTVVKTNIFDIRAVSHEPGEYAIFVQTRRLRRGWPKSQKSQYHGTSELAVTSSNIVHITMLP